MRNTKLRKITDYQRRMWIVCSYFALCRYIVERDEAGKFIVKNPGKCRRFFYYFCWVNGFVKVTYLGLAYKHVLPVEVHFLDQMGIVDWYLCFSIACQAVWIWAPRKTYEVLAANWNLQEEIYEKLGAPNHIETGIVKTDRNLNWMHIFIVGGSAFSIWVQFFTFPKYAAYLYAIIPIDHWYLRIIFCTHEMIFVVHVWIHEAWSIVLLENFSNSYALIINEMTDVLHQLIHLGVKSNNGNNYSRKERPKSAANKGVSSTALEKFETYKRNYILNRKLNPTTVVPGTTYDIMGLLHDYQKMMIATNAYNAWIGKVMGGTMMSNYSQFVSDVFMICQLLREPEVDLFGVIFYLQDASVGMWMLFRMLIIIAKVYPASEDFLHALKKYISNDTPLRPYLLKFQKGLIIVAQKIGGVKTKPETVPQGINVLMNWYICAAMWKRPQDRLT